MKTFGEWLGESHYEFNSVKAASEWKQKWFNIARNYLKKMEQEGEGEVIQNSIWRINQIAKKLEALGDEPLTANRVAMIAADEESGHPEVDAHFEELIDALERE